MTHQLTEKEVKNSAIIFNMLTDVPNVSFEQATDRPDIFILAEESTGLDRAVLDVEDDTVITMMEIEKYPNGLPNDLAVKLLQANNSATHGAFVLTPENTVVFKHTLEIENLDLNELQASLDSVFLQSLLMLDTLANEEGE